MAFPRVEIEAHEALSRAEEKVEKALEAVGGELVAFENLNTALPFSESCHFFHLELEGRDYVVVVATGAWTEEKTITVLNILLELRLDPDPPGTRLAVRFFSAEAVPAVLLLLFGDSPVSELECRACLAARFGHELVPEACEQLAAAAVNLGREVLGLALGFFDPATEPAIAQVVCELRSAAPPVEPLNALILFGALYGEVLRTGISWPGRWARVRRLEPWPALVFRAAAGSAEPRRTTAEGDTVAFSPISHVLHLYRTGDRAGFERAAAELKARCQ